MDMTFHSEDGPKKPERPDRPKPAPEKTTDFQSAAIILAEQNVLGTCLLQSSLIDTVAGIVQPADFWRTDHQALFRLLSDMRRQAQPIDSTSVLSRVVADAAAYGGAAYVLSLYDATAKGPALGEHIEHHARAVAEAARKRALWEFYQHQAAKAFDPGADVDAAIAKSRALLDSIESRGSSVNRFTQKIIDMTCVSEDIAEIKCLFGSYVPAASTVWLSGGTGTGKSTVIYNIVTAIAEGTHLWGIVPTQSKILYLDLESGDVGRALKLTRLYQGSPRIGGKLFFLPDAPRLPEQTTDLLSLVKDMTFDLVVFDTVRRAFQVADENDNAEVYAKVVPVLDALKASGVASLVVGHVPKGGTGPRGAGAQEDAGDVNLSLTMHSGEVNDPEGVIKIAVTKHRIFGMDVPPLLLKRIGDDRFERVEAADYPQAETEKPLKKSTQCANEIMFFLASQEGREVPFKLIVKAMGNTENNLHYSEGTTQRGLTELIEAGKIRKGDTGYAAIIPDF